MPVFGVDTAEPMVALAVKASCHAARSRSDAGLESALAAFTGGHGFDAVIITAATQSTDPVELATTILRQKGVIVVVGAVPMNVPREPHFYKKELEVKISCRTGPGATTRRTRREGRITRTAMSGGPRTVTWERSCGCSRTGAWMCSL